MVSSCQLFHCPDVAGAVDEASTKVLADCFKCEEPATEHLFLQISETFTKHKNTVKMGGTKDMSLREGIGGPGELVCPVVTHSWN